MTGTKQHSTAMHDINCSIMHLNAEDEEDWEEEEEVEEEVEEVVEEGQEEEKIDIGSRGNRVKWSGEEEEGRKRRRVASRC